MELPFLVCCIFSSYEIDAMTPFVQWSLARPSLDADDASTLMRSMDQVLSTLMRPMNRLACNRRANSYGVDASTPAIDQLL